RTPEDDEDDGNGEEDQGLRISEEERIQEEEEVDELYRDVDINQGRGLQVSQDIEDSHVTLTPVHPDGQQESSSVSSFVTSMLNPTNDAGVESIFMTASSPIAPLPTPTPIMTLSTIATITTSSDAPIPPTTIPSATNQFAEAVSKIPGILHQYMTQQMTEAVREAVQIQTDRLQDSFQRENDEFLRTIDENMKKIIKGQVKTELTEMELKKILIEKMEGNKSIQRSDEQRNLYKALVDAYEADKTIFESYRDTAILKRRRGDDDDQEGPSAGSDWGSKRRREAILKRRRGDDDDQEGPSAGSGRGSKRRREGGEHESASTPSELATRSASSLTKLEYHLEEVYKATTDQLDWVNPEGQLYPHILLQPLPLIPDNQGRRVISFAHFINNDLEYLRG
nr:hypothetical protein [Tanacetum cinerariifolium]